MKKETIFLLEIDMILCNDCSMRIYILGYFYHKSEMYVKKLFVRLPKASSTSNLQN